MTTYLHGVEVLEQTIPPPIATESMSVIGLVGTADKGKDTPTLVTSLEQGTAIFGETGTIYQSLKAIFSQASAPVVVVKTGTASTSTKANGTTGIDLLLSASNETGYVPKILLAIGYGATNDDSQAIANKLSEVADKLKAIAIVDVFVAANSATKVTDATNYLKGLTGKLERLYAVYPGVKDLSGAKVPASPYIAGAIAGSDQQRGWWWSPSNFTLAGIQGASEPISFTLGERTCDANVLNQAGIATIIQQQGCRVWGDRSAIAKGSPWQFLSVRRIADAINESLLKAHFWAVDQNITKNYVDSIESSVNAYLRSLKAQGAIIDGRCWADPQKNTPTNIQNGELYFNFDFTPPYPAEHITFTSALVNDYLNEVFS
jgi:uncharacterized protein